MVKLGFIVEGDSEKIILEKSGLFQYLNSLSVSYLKDVTNSRGSGNLLPYNIEKYSEKLQSKGVTNIFILTDLDNDVCITITKNRISPLKNQTVIVSIKEIESWFLSDTKAIRKFLNSSDYSCQNPESIKEPYKEICSLKQRKNRFRIPSKRFLADKMVENGFSILKAAEHPNCNSAKYFIKKIQELSPLQTFT
jgi:hypothetical protein